MLCVKRYWNFWTERKKKSRFATRHQKTHLKENFTKNPNALRRFQGIDMNRSDPIRAIGRFAGAVGLLISLFGFYIGYTEGRFFVPISESKGVQFIDEPKQPGTGGHFLDDDGPVKKQSPSIAVRVLNATIFGIPTYIVSTILVMLCFLALRWLWYFLLARLSEVAKAIRGEQKDFHEP